MLLICLGPCVLSRKPCLPDPIEPIRVSHRWRGSSVVEQGSHKPLVGSSTLPRATPLQLTCSGRAFQWPKHALDHFEKLELESRSRGDVIHLQPKTLHQNLEVETGCLMQCANLLVVRPHAANDLAQCEVVLLEDPDLQPREVVELPHESVFEVERKFGNARVGDRECAARSLRRRVRWLDRAPR